MILFRTDANSEIGFGHMMRCLSIADAFSRKGYNCIFAVSDDSSKEQVLKFGYEVISMNSDYKKIYNDQDSIRHLIRNKRIDITIVDSYFVTYNYLDKLKEESTVVYIDDLAMFAYPVDVLINYNFNGMDIDYQKLYRKNKIIIPELLIGPQFAPLRSQFIGLTRSRHKQIKNILILTGGSDPINLSLNLSERINETEDMKDFIFHFVVGPLYQKTEELKRMVTNGSNIVIHQDVSDMSTLISNCDLVVSAAGSTVYEVLACGIPLIIYVSADNQLNVASAIVRNKVAISCGDLRKIDYPEKKVLSVIMRYVSDTKKNVNSFNFNRLVDGKGADRIVSKLLEINLQNSQSIL